MERIRQVIDDLSTCPQSGDSRDEILPGILRIQHEDVVIYFQVTSSQLGVDILAVGSADDDPKYDPKYDLMFTECPEHAHSAEPGKAQL